MAVETKYGAYVRGAAEETPIGTADLNYTERRVRAHMDKISFGAAADVASVGYFGKLPSHAIILPTSKLWFGAAGTSCTLDIGDSNDPNGLATVIDVSSAGSSDLLEAIAAANKARPLWEHLGYSADPGGDIDLYCSIAGAAATNAFDIVFLIEYVV